MKALSPKERLTKLTDRTLYYDGDSTISEKGLTEIITKGQTTDGLFISELSDDVKKYNRMVPKDQQLGIKVDIAESNLEFDIPNEFLKLDVDEYVVNKLTLEMDSGNFIPAERAKRVGRTISELALYEKLGLINVLRTLIYIINTLQDKKIVWGVGRGSGVASYVLYLIGVHDVDSIKYDLDITDFLRS